MFDTIIWRLELAVRGEGFDVTEIAMIMGACVVLHRKAFGTLPYA